MFAGCIEPFLAIGNWPDFTRQANFTKHQYSIAHWTIPVTRQDRQDNCQVRAGFSNPDAANRVIAQAQLRAAREELPFRRKRMEILGMLADAASKKMTLAMPNNRDIKNTSPSTI